ncbi:Ig-like domain-containing protein [Coraliomargarita sinensis]|uniref:Ig-like domain-containing protein n=1 Tax=Coraliomargarita sinensis TaxID=2174842 RepID=UPI001304B664|nr:Ig-like domain-containing protein [Coraliomargarita sinensis]
MPDLTAGGEPTDSEYINLGPTGMEGWIYNKGSGKLNETVDARQILVTAVDAGSPADGILAVGDVILGADGTGASPVSFTSDARKALAYAIDDAEGNNPAVLKLLRWRSGVTTEVSITLEYLGGSYSATAPYNCLKSAAILEKGIEYIMNNVTDTGYGGFAPTVLLAANDPANPDNAARQARAQAEAYELNLTQDEIDDMESNDLTRSIGKPWNIGPALITQAEYYLQTGDSTVLPSIRARAVQIANAQSMFGTMGHHYSLPGPNGELNQAYGIGYGPVNNAGMPCFLGLILAEKCGLTDQRILDGIARAAKYFQYYADLGTVPYGENKETGSIANNGKSGLNAIALGMLSGYEHQAKYFSKMSVFGASERDGGHTGPFFNHLWTPLGANFGGQDALVNYFQTTSWLYDLQRRWDGDFVYHPYYQNGGISDNWGQGHKPSWTTLLTYAAPLKQIHITGKSAAAAQVLDATDIAHIDFAKTYDPTTRTTTELIEDLKSPLPQLHWSASSEIGTNRTADHATILPTLIDIAQNSTVYAERHGAIFALGQIADDSTAPVLAGLCSDPDSKVRYMAANSLNKLSLAAKTAEVATIVNGLVANDRPVLPLDPENPLHVEKQAFASLLFDGNNGIWGGTRVDTADRNLLYPAFRILATAPMGVTARVPTMSVAPYLTKADVDALADVLVDVAYYQVPAENSYSQRADAITAMRTHNYADGVPVAIRAYGEVTKNHGMFLTELENYAASSLLVNPDPQVIEFCKQLVSTEDPYFFGQKYHEAAQAVLDAIAADQLPEQVVPFKSVDWVFADQPSLTLPATSTVLRVQSSDLAKGTPYYTWRKVHGAGEVSFAPNGTAEAKDTTVLFDGTAGVYTFEVTMADEKGLTEAYGTVTVTLNESGGSLPANTAPTANADSITAGQGTPTQLTLTGSDPEGQDLIYKVLDGPSNGYLTGTAPDLVYTSDLAYTGADSVTFEVMDTEGLLSASATVSITVNAVTDVGLAIYEPFDYPTGGFNGSSSVNEIGLDGSWTAQANMDIVGGSLNYGSLVTNGSALSASDSIRSHAASRAISPTALAGNGLLDDGATLWFSAMLGHPGMVDQIYMALANDQLSNSADNHYIVDDGAQLGSGLGVWLDKSEVRATHFRDSSQGGQVAGTWTSQYGAIKSGVQRLVVGKINWGANSDTIEIYLPWEDLILPSAPSSTLTVDVDQSTFDTLTFSRNGTPLIDEIRFGSNYQSVIQGTVAMVPDTSAPTPDPMTFAVAPTPISSSSITMTATTAFDLNGVEYYFTCTAGGGNDSGWQDSNVYTDSGLTPGVEYSYTVKARDKQPAGNATAASGVASATIPVGGTVPDLVGIEQSSAEDLLGLAELSVGTITDASAYSLTIPAGHVLSQTPAAGSTAAYGSAVDLEISIGQDPALPTLASVDIVDDQSGGPVVINTAMTYTLTFSEDIDAATLDAADFVNVGDVSVTIGTITETSPGVVTVDVTPTSIGLLRFAVAQGASIQDAQGDAFNSDRATIDDTVITVNLTDEVVPDVVGLAQTTAESDIVAANLVVGTVNNIYDELVPGGDVISQDPIGGSSIPGQSPVDLVVSLGPPPDTTGPVVVSTDPADAAYNVEANANLHVTFDEDVFTNSGNIVIRNLTDGGDVIISVTDTAQVSAYLNVLTIDPAEDLVGGKSYAVRIASGAVVDASGNEYAGINDNSVWNFSTSPTGLETTLLEEDFEAPDVAAYAEGTTPANWVRADQGFNASRHGLSDKAGGDFSAADPNHQAYAFRYGNSGITTAEGALKAIEEGDTYEISFDVVRDDGANSGTPYDARLIAYTLGDPRNDCRTSDPGIELMAVTGDARTDGLFSTVVFNYTVAAGDPAIGMDLTLRIKGASTSAIIDNVSVKTITNPNEPDQVPPAVASLTPNDDAENVPVTDNLRIVFDEDIAVGAGNITIKNLNNGSETVINAIDGNQVLLIGDTLEINPEEDLDSLTFYSVQIEPGVITDLAGNGYAGISDDISWTFNTGETSDSVAPGILALSPGDGASGVSYRTNLTLTMNENVVVNAGNITLKNLTDSTQVVIDVKDSSQVSAAGPDVTITPANYFAEGKNYAVQIDAGAILDLSGNPFAGIADDTTWNFSISANNPPAVATLNPADESVNVDIATNLVVTFDEDIAAGTGNLTLRNVNTSSDLLIDVNDGTQVTISGATLTINPASNLAEATNYAILIDAGAVEDLAGNSFGGITSEATWNIATGVSQVGLAFSDDFEVASGSPDVDASGSGGDTSKQTGPNWVRATQAFGSDRHGIVDESSNQFTDPGGEQAYAFRYTNSGITTVESAIGTLQSGKIYRVSFNVVGDGYNNGGAYNVGLVTFAPGASRNDVSGMGNGTSMVLATASGDYTGTAYQLVSFEYISDGSSDAAVQGHDLAIRLDGATTTANIDNVQITINDAPNDVVAPTLAGSDIVDNQSGGPILTNTPVTYTVTFSEDMDAATVTAADFSNAGTAAVTIGSVSEPAPGVFSIEATPTTEGTLQMQVSAGAVLDDLAGNALDTTSAIADDTTITVDAPNNPPVAQNDSVSTNEDTPVAITLVATDADSDPLTYAVVTPPSNGVLTGTAPNLTYTPNSAFSGSDSFTFKANDGTVDSNTATVSITVNAGPANNAPVASDDSVTTDEDVSVAIALVATDADSDPLTYSVEAAPTNGTLTGTEPNLTYTPDVGYAGSDSFTFKANDGTEDSNIATVSITVNAAPVEGVVFADDFEAGANPYGGTTADVASYNLNNTSKSANTALWVRSSDGFGSDRNGLIDEIENSGLNFTDPVGEQAYGFRYTNSGVTTAEGILGALTNGTTIDVSFDVVMDGHNSGTAYDALLLLFDPGANRSSLQYGEKGSSAVLARATGNATGDGSYTTITFSYVVGDPVVDNDGDGGVVDSAWLATLIGKDIALRFDGATTCANIDNVEVSITSEGGGDTTAPTLAGSDIVDDAAGGPVVENTSVTYTLTFSEDMDATTVDVTDFGNAGTSTISVNSVTETTAGVFSVAVTPTNSGTLQLQVNAGAALKDLAGNSLETTSAILDDTTITVEGSNSAPVANDDSAATNEDTGVAITLSASDADLDPLTYVVVDAPSNGILSGTAPDLTYTPNGDYNGSDSFTFKANDGTVDSDIATISITINAVNDAPVANSDSAVTNEDTSVAITLTGSDVDVAETLTYVVVSGPSSGSLSGTAPDLTYTPNGDYNGSDSFTFVTNDGTADSNTATISITVNAVNDAPMAVSDTASTDEDAGVAITLVASDIELDPLNFAVVSGPANGTLSGTAPNLTYTPNADYNGSDSFTFKANDGTLDSNTATISITVNAINDAPVFTVDPIAGSDATEDAAYTGSIAGSATDAEEDTLTYALVSPATWLSVASDGTLSGTPTNSAVGAHSFTVSVSDGTAAAVEATLDITVINTNDAPVANDDSATTDEDTGVVITLTGSDVDVGDTLTYSVVPPPSNGSLSGTAPNLTYTPNGDFSGSDSFSFKTNDGTTDSNTATVSITVNAVNDAPVANNDSASTDEDTGVAITLTASDVDTGDTLTYAVVTVPTNGTLSGTAPNLTYTPNADYNGSDSFTFEANDGTVDSNTATVSLTVNAVDDAPVANDDSVSTDEDNAVAITLVATDADNDPLTYTVETPPANGVLSGTAPNLTYTPNSDYNGTDNFTFSATGNAVASNVATVGITVNAVNDAPVFASDPFSASDATEDAVYSGTIAGSATDADGETLSYAKVDGASWLIVGSDGSLSGTPLNADVGGNSFTISASDGMSTTQATLTIDVINVNDAPSWNSDPVAEVDATVDAAYSSSLADDATDEDGDTLTYSLVSSSTWLIVGSDGSLSGTPTSADLGSNTFTVSVSDGTAASVEATLTIEVAGAGTVVFSEDFESPDVTGYSEGTTPVSWVRATQGFGATRHGLNDEASGEFTGPVGAQAYSFRYTNSGITTSEGQIGALTSGTTYEVSFDVVADGSNAGDNYTVALVTFNGAARNDVRGGDGGAGITSLLNTATGAYSGTTYQTVTFNYTADGSEASLGHDIAVRIIGQSTSANIDNLSVSVSGGGSGNTAPVADDQSASTNEDNALAVTLTASDADSDPLTYAVVSSPSNGTLSGTTPNLTYTPNAEFNGSDSFTFKTNDGTVDSNTAMVSITVNAVNDEPVADDQSVGTDEDVNVAVTLTASDPDGDDLAYSVVIGPSDGILSGTAPNLTYTPGNNYNGSDSFTFKVNDGTVDSNTATVSITINPVNDAPIFNSAPFSASDAIEGNSYSDSIFSAASDPEGDLVTYSKVSGPAWLAVASDGALSGTPGSGDVGVNTFVVSASDGTGSTEATMTVEVVGLMTEDYAYAETLVSGTVSGSIADTYDSDDTYETITEEESNGKPSERHSFLEYIWEFDVVGGTSVSFNIEAHHSANSEGDDFIFAYSTTGENGTYINMLTITKTSDDNTTQSFTLPEGTSGVIHVIVLDADATAGNNVPDTLSIDRMYFLSE